MKNYYRILGVSQSATSAEIRSAYRKLALRYHPDHNPNNCLAEERFKEVAEAYGVLTDRRKREELDRRSGGREERTAPASGEKKNFGYAREEIFRDMFGNPEARDFFSELEREFRKKGYRFDQAFFNEIFFRKKGSFFGGEFARIGREAKSSPARPSEEIRHGRRAEDAGCGIWESFSGLFRRAWQTLRKWKKR